MGTIEISCVEVWREISNYIDAEISPELRERDGIAFHPLCSLFCGSGNAEC